VGAGGPGAGVAPQQPGDTGGGPDLRKLAQELSGKTGPAVDHLTTVPDRVGHGDRDAHASATIPGSSMPPLAEAAAADAGRSRSKRGMHPAIPFLAAIFLIVGVLVGLVMLKRKNPDPGPPVVDAAAKEKAEEARRNFLRDGWKAHSTNTLTGFLRAGSLEQKSGFVLGSESRLEEMRKFYGAEKKIDESDTPIELFSHFDLDIADKRRGLFLMQYERPVQYDIKEFFRPVAPLEVQHRLEEPGLLLSAFADRENFAMAPVRVMTFFKEVDGKLRLDWDVYTQTKYRALRFFATYPQPGQSKVFRVMTREVLPAVQPDEGTQHRYFRFSDPAHVQDHVDVPVAADATPGRILADLAWINLPGREAQNRYATVELGWTQDEEPQVILRKVICWEFLGLGGVAGNADPVEGADSNPVILDALGSDPLAPSSAPPATAPLDPEPVKVPGGEAEDVFPGELAPAAPRAEEGSPAAESAGGATADIP